MSEVSGNGHYVVCPLCEGRGQFHRSDLVQQLKDPGLPARIAGWLKKLERGGEAEAPACEETVECVDGEFEREVHSWPAQRILWRRSPKE